MAGKTIATTGPMTSSEDRPHGELRGPFMCQMVDRDAVRELRATGACDGWPEAALQAEDLVIVYGCTDETGRRWSYLLDGAAFRAATADGFGSMDFTEQILLFEAGWPEDWGAEAKAEKARARADSAERAMERARSAERAMARTRARNRQPAGPVRGWLTYVPGPDGGEIGIVEGRDDTGRPWTIRFKGYALRAAIAEARTLEAQAGNTSAVTA